MPPVEVIEMKNTINDPIDHVRTNCQFTGEAMKDGRISPGLLLSAMGVLALAVSLYLFGIGNMAGGGLSLAVAAVIGIGAVAWLLGEHRRVVHQQVRWRVEHRQ